MENKSFFQNLTSLSDKFTDVSVIVEGISYHCHKIILSSFSEFFKRRLLTELNSSSEDILLDDVSSSTFEIFHKYIYSGCEANVLSGLETSKLIELLQFGDEYLAPQIYKHCIEILKKKAGAFSLDDLMDVFKSAINQNCIELLNVIKLNLKRFGKQLSCEKAFQLNITAFNEYIICCKVTLTEVERFKMVEMWIKKQGYDTARTAFSFTKTYSSQQAINAVILLKSIEYKKMTVDEFYNGPGKSDIIDEGDKFSTLYNITKNNGQHKYCYRCREFYS